MKDFYKKKAESKSWWRKKVGEMKAVKAGGWPVEQHDNRRLEQLFNSRSSQPGSSGGKHSEAAADPSKRTWKGK